MKILSRYLARDFVKYLLLCLLAMLLLMMVGTLFSNINTVFSSWAALKAFLDTLVRSLPGVIELLLPMTVLLATMFTFNALSRDSELLAMKTAGMGHVRLIVPLFVPLLAVAAFAYYNQNYLFRLLHGGGDTVRELSADRDLWRSWEKNVIYMSRVDPARRTVTNLHVFQIDAEPFRLSEIGKVAFGSQKASNWVFSERTERRLKDGLWDLKQEPWQEVPADAFPDVFRSVETDAQHLTFAALQWEIRQRSAQGSPIHVFVLYAHQKVAALAALFLMVLVGAPLSQFHFRRGRVAGEIMLSILIGIAYWLSNEILTILGKGGLLAPAVAVWTVPGLYLLLGAVLLIRTR